MYFLYFNFFLGGLLFFFLGFYFYWGGVLFQFYWCLGTFDYMFYYFECLFDSYSLMFLGVIFLVSSMIFYYSYGYIDSYSCRFFYMVLLFVFSMGLLVVSPNLFSMMLGWDGLGVISFCLVAFYYGSDYSSDCSMVTMLYNRFGDAMLLVGLGFCYVVGGFSFFSYLGWGVFLCLLILFGLCTKSAQYPFFSWLPKAMAAPTPVSSLVHSSTLVTSGMYILFRYKGVLGEGFFLLVYISLFSMIIGGFLSLFSFDIKKVIAYSTLSQIGFMLNSLGMGGGDFMYFHMLTHAVFKSMMFMCAGVIIHVVGSQDIRFCGGVMYILPLTSYIMFIGILSLMGFPFLSGFYSKDVVVDFVFCGLGSGFFMFFYFFGIFLTMSYGARLFYYLYLCSVSLFCFSFLGEIFFMSNSMLFLFLGSIFCGCLLSTVWLDFSVFGGLGGFVGGFVLFCFLFGVFVCYYVIVSGGFYFLFFLFFIDSYYYYIKFIGVLISKILIIFDKYWVECIIGLKFYNFLFSVYLGVSGISFNMVFLICLFLICGILFYCSYNLFKMSC